jgi:hypothetical protein
MKGLPMKRVVLFFLLLMVVVACQNTREEVPVQTSGHAVTVNEVAQANAYTYLNVSENGESFWIAITKSEIAVGEKLYYDSGLEMTNFESKDLNRTFEKIYFVDQVSTEPAAAPPAMHGGSEHAGRPAVDQQSISVEPVKGGITIGELYKEPAKFKNETVKIRGQVTKVNSMIMGRNWVHIQDGTSSDGKFDLTITTNDNVNVGDTVIFEGKVTLEKDFGAGYYYDVIVEQATVVRQQTS